MTAWMDLESIMLSETSQELGGHNGGKREKGCQGTCINDTCTKPKVGRIEGGRKVVRAGVGGSCDGKMETTVLEQFLKKREKKEA